MQFKSLFLLLFLPSFLIAQHAPSTKADLHWEYLVFEDVPSKEQARILAKNNIQLYQYQPDLTWLASFPANTENRIFKEAGVMRIFSPGTQQKIAPEIYFNQVPNYAQSANGVKTHITIAAVKEYDLFQSALERLGIQVTSIFEPLGILKAEGTPQSLVQAAQLPYVIYIELIDPPAELEIEDEMASSRAPYMNGYYNLDGINGEGIDIAVNEGGTVNPAFDPDFKNRLNRTQESGNTSGHKTNVGWRMASAGNIDPVFRGQAWGATLHSGGINFTNAALGGINIVNNSFGYGCISGNATYNSGAALNDYLVRTYPTFMITYSCGNIGGSSCASYGAGPGWGSITGLVKSAKNIFAVGALSTNDQLTGFSSRGPAKDGRILPDITAAGPGGTSYASPNLGGVNALLTHAYREENNNQWPASGLIKGIILNTADDLENPGPDFRTGFGRINAKRGQEVIVNGQFINDNITNNTTKTHSISVPTGVQQVKISLYWTDREATAGITGKTLVNNLDLRVQAPNSSAWTLPWVLNTFPHNDSLILNAIHGIDTLNNVELVTFDNPAAGTYTVEVDGDLVPFGPQNYHVIYSFVYDSVNVIFPKGGEGLVPGEQRRIRWDAADAGGQFNIELSTDSGLTWQSIAAGVANDARHYVWNIPNTISGLCQVKISNANQSSTSDLFTIAEPPVNLQLVWRCADSAMFAWDSVPGALAYRVYRLGNKFMDTATTSTTNYTMLYNLSSTESEWISVQTILPDSGSSRRAIATEIPLGDSNCVGNDLAVKQIISPVPGQHPSCLSGSALEVKVLLQNTGTTYLSYIPMAYQLNNGPIIHDTLNQGLNSPLSIAFTFQNTLSLSQGNHSLKVWSTYPNDGNSLNDTLVSNIVVYTSNGISLPYTQTFDSFNTCSTAWGCAGISCGLSQGFLNVPNTIGGDSIDWRTHSGATGSGGTGPSSDHTSGSGRYLYLEGSGNNGSGCQNHEAHLHTPCINLVGTNMPTLSYWHHAFGNSIGEMHIDVLSEGAWHLDITTPVIGQQGNQWVQRQVDLSDFVGEQIIVRFRGSTGNGWASDMAIDDINITTLPLVAFETTNDTFCLGQIVSLQNQTSYGTNYTWNVVQSTYTYNAGNMHSISPSIEPLDTGWYDVELIAANSTGADTLLLSNFFYVRNAPTPSLNSNAINNHFCFGDTAQLTANDSSGIFTFYLNGVLTQSGNLNTWNISSFTSGDSVWVLQEINPTCFAQSASIELNIQAKIDGSALNTSAADLIICEGESVEFTTIPEMAQYDYFINGTLISSSTDSSFTSNTLSDGDVVFTLLTDSIGCAGSTDSLTFTVNPTPSTPSILPQGQDSLRATSIASSYLWEKDAIALPQNTQIIPLQGQGDYTVAAQDGQCISGTSDIYNHTTSSVNEVKLLNAQVYPNPAKDLLYIQQDKRNYSQLILIDATGKEVIHQTLQSGINSISISELAPGFYSAQLVGEGAVSNLTVVVH